MRLTELRGRRVAVWGTGREGLAALRAIAPVQPADLVAVDDRMDFLAADQWDGTLGPRRTGEEGFAALRAAEVVVRSPGVPETHPWMVALREEGVRVTGGTALWMSQHGPATIGVTGSKGKSTTASLISHLLNGLGRPNALGGNIGVPVLDLPPAPEYVLELSMYQCADLDDSPRVAVLTTLYPEHLDWAGSEERYYRFKLNIAAHRPETVVYNARDARLSTRVPPGAVGAGTPDSFHVADGWVRCGATRLFERSALPLPGRHNEDNLCVGLAALAAVGVDCVARREEISGALSGFQALPSRLTPIPDPSGVLFVDDSLSTIPQAAMHAIEAYADRPLTVILGGQDRGVDYTPLRDFLADKGIRATLIGVPDSGPHILEVIGDLPGITAVRVGDLTEAVRVARAVTPAGGVVLLSPAAPSYGRFDNYQHRARVFREAVTATAPATASDGSTSTRTV